MRLMRSNKNGKPRVVIIGAGFGGLWALRSLRRADVEVLLIDKNNYHTFLPLLYQVAAAEISPESIVHPIRNLIRKYRHFDFLMDEVTSIDFDNKMVLCKKRSVEYDYLVMAPGSRSNFFNIKGVKEFAFRLKSIDQGIKLRNHILKCFERATHEEDPEIRDRILNFSIIGGGATGVEFAGALMELVQTMNKKDYHNIDKKDISIYLVEMDKSLLSYLPEKLQQYTIKKLEKKNVKVLLNSTVCEICENEVRLKDGTKIPTETVVWTAGVKGSELTDNGDFANVRNGRVTTEKTLQMENYKEVFVVGDTVLFEEENLPVPMVAPAAMQQGATAGKNIIRSIEGRPLKTFSYKDYGSMVVIGRNKAVVHMFNMCITGFTAWIIWLGVHILKLVGFRDRFSVLIDWASSYIFIERNLKLIVPSSGKKIPE